MSAPDTSHELYEQLAVGHALDALEPEDELQFTRHLAHCAACQRAVAEHTETLSHLAYAAEDAEPPAALRDGILAGVAASGRSGLFPAPVQLDELGARRARRERTVKLTTALVGVAASFVLLVALLLVNNGLQSRNDDLARQDAAFRTTVSSLLTPGARQVPLEGNGKAVAVVAGRQVSLVMSGLAPNDAAHSTYVLWERSRFGDVRAVGTFDVRSSGTSVVASGLQLTKSPDALATLIVTRESGRTAPSVAKGAVVIEGRL